MKDDKTVERKDRNLVESYEPKVAVEDAGAQSQSYSVNLQGETGKEWWQGRAVSLLSPLLLLLLWEVASRVGLVRIVFFPPPSAIVGEFFEMLISGILIKHVRISLFRVFAGFFAGTLPAVVIGLTMGLFPFVRKALEPVVAALYPIPKLALLPLIMLIFGLGETMKIVTIASGCFFLVLINTVAGVVNIEPIYLDVAKNYGASRKDFYLTVALPGAMPMIFTGLKLGMGVSLLLIVAAEYVGARSGIGYLIWTSYQTFNLEQMYIGLIMMSFFGYLFTLGLNELERIIIPWKE